MRKGMLVVLLLLCVAASLNCGKAREERTLKGTQNENVAQNENLISNVNAVPTPETEGLVRNPQNKAVLITVNQTDKGVEIDVSPDKIKLSKGKGQRLRFYCFNNLDQDLGKVEVVFTSGPFEGGAIETGTVPSGMEAHTSFRRIRQDAEPGNYKYSVRVTISGVKEPVVLDPDVEIGT